MPQMSSTASDMGQLNQRVSTALAENPYVSRRHQLSFRTDEGRVTLHGHVGTFFEKQMAQEALRSVAGVKEIENQLVVAGWS